jgi:hypothetical protein
LTKIGGKMAKSNRDRSGSLLPDSNKPIKKIMAKAIA